MEFLFEEKDPTKMSEMLGNQYFINGVYEKAIEVYEEVLKNDPQNSDVLLHCILAELKLGLLEKAFVHYLRLIKLCPSQNVLENVYLKPVCLQVQSEESLFEEETDRRLARAILDGLCGHRDRAEEIFHSLKDEFAHSQKIQELLNEMEGKPNHV